MVPLFPIFWPQNEEDKSFNNEVAVNIKQKSRKNLCNSDSCKKGVVEAMCFAFLLEK